MADGTILVIGGGPAGLEAARTAAGLGASVVLVEGRDRLGGAPDAEHYAKLTHRFQDAEEAIGAIIASVVGDPAIEVLTGSQVVASEGQAGAFRVTVQSGSTLRSFEVGAIVVATGFQHFDPGRETQLYNYYSFPDVVTLTDLEGMLKASRVVRPSNGRPPERVAFIQCVGSRDRQIGNEYCSKVCCAIASKQAIEIKQLLPDARVFIFYIDIRTFGYWENELYWPAQEQYKVSYVKGLVSEVLPKGDRLLVRGEDTTMGRPMEVEMDLVVLSVGMEPSAGTRGVAKALGLEQNKYGFIAAGGRTGLDPVATSRPGIFVAGTAAGPADLDESFASAGLAAARAMIALRQPVPTA